MKSIELENLSPLAPIPTDFPEKALSLSGIKAVIFDIYGTLLISGSGDIGVNEPVNTQEVFQATLKKFGISNPKLLIDDFKTEIKKSHQLLREKGIDYPEVEIRDIWKSTLSKVSHTLDNKTIEKLALTYENTVNPTWPMPGAKSVLHALSEKGFVLGIVSNAQFYTKTLMQHFFGEDIFPGVFTKELCVFSFEEHRGKPSLPLFNRIIEEGKKRSISPSEMLYVGNDMLNDMYTASKNGLKTALFAGDKRSLRLRQDKDLVKDIVPDAVIKNLTNLNQLSITN